MNIRTLLVTAAAIALPATALSAQTTEAAPQPGATATPSSDDAQASKADPSASTTQGTTPPADTAADAAADAADPAAANAADTAATSSTTETGKAAGATQLASAADVVAGAKVMDQKGAPVGTIEKVDANGAVVSTGTARVQIPVASFAKNDQGLVISASKSELEAAAKASSPS